MLKKMIFLAFFFFYHFINLAKFKFNSNLIQIQI